MNLTGKSSQTGIYIGLIVLLGAVATFGYRELNQRLVFFRQARILYAAGQPEAALPLFEKSFAQGLSSPTALMLAAGAALASGNKELAAAFLDAFLLRTTRPTLDQLNEIAGLYDGYGMPEAAAALYSRYAPRVMADQAAALRLADFQRRAGEFEQARRTYAAILTAWPGQPEARLGLAETEGWAGAYPRALELAGEILRANPGDRRARLLYARLLSWSGRFGEAIQEYRNYLGDAS